MKIISLESSDSDSDTESVKISTSSSTSTPKRGCNRKYIHHKTFPNTESAIKYIEAEGAWVHYREYDSKLGRKRIYRCKLVKYREKQCAASLMLVFHPFDRSVSIMKTDCAHTHNIEALDHGISPDIRCSIIDYIKKGKF